MFDLTDHQGHRRRFDDVDIAVFLIRLSGSSESHGNLSAASRGDRSSDSPGQMTVMCRRVPIMSHQPPSLSASTSSFEPIPYRSDGVIYWGNGLQLVGLLGILAVILGLIAGVVIQFFNMILLFPIAIGIALGFVGAKGVRYFHLRNPWFCGLAGIVAGCAAMPMTHYVSYQKFESKLLEELGEEGRAVREIALRRDDIRANWDQATPEEREIIEELEKNPEGLRALRVNSLVRFVDMQAHFGMEILNQKGAPKAAALNLGYLGSWVYWIGEMLIVAGIVCFWMCRAAADPYCSQCNQWKRDQVFGPFPNSKEVARIIKEGQLSRFEADPDPSEMGGYVRIFKCPECHLEGAPDVFAERWTMNQKGEVLAKRLVGVTYPAAAFPALYAICSTSLFVDEESLDDEEEEDDESTDEETVEDDE